MKLVAIINAMAALAVLSVAFSPAPSHAETYRRYWVDPYDRYEPGFRYHPGAKGNDYTVESTMTDSAGNPITIRTEVERDRNNYNRKTTVTGADGQELGSREVDIDFDRNKTQRTTTTTSADGTVDIQTQTYRNND